MRKTFFVQQRTVVLLTMLFMAGVLILAGYFSWKQYERHQRIRAEVAILETQRERVQKENESLKERINYFATEEFKEQESKERLNMRKNNEYVVEIEQNGFNKEEDKGSQKAEKLESLVEVPYYKKWWAKIFE
jgi:predicted negative regulator of RcsB-dependent stress response